MNKKMCVLIVIALLVGVPAISSAAALRPAELKPDCPYVFNPVGGTPPGFDAIAQQIMLLLSLPGIIGVPAMTWQTADLETEDGINFGDGIPDHYQWGMLGAALCAGDPLLLGQFETNRTAVIGVINQLRDACTTVSPMVPVIGAASDAIESWGMGLAPGEWQDQAFDLNYWLSDTEYALTHDIGQWLPVVSNLLPQYANWFVAAGGLSTRYRTMVYSALNDLLWSFNSTCSGKPISIYRFNLLKDGLQSLISAPQPPMTPELAAQCADLVDMIDVLLPKLEALQTPSLVIYGVTGKSTDEPFAASGDYNGDGITNEQAYELVKNAGGNRFDFVRAAASASPFWPGNTALPVTSVFGLALLGSACGLIGARFLRKK